MRLAVHLALRPCHDSSQLRSIHGPLRVLDEMPETRPPITPLLTLPDFVDWYWLKADLVSICRLFTLSTSGSKLELEDRIRRHLSGQQLRVTVKRRMIGEMPVVFTPKTMISKGWKCNPALGAFMRELCGSGFRFNAQVRDFIHNGEGRTLAEAAICYRASIQPRSHKTSIPRQLEYNQHFRDFFAAQPGASRQQAIDAWWDKRSRRGGTRTETG